jgi:hypothetical protein
MPVDKGKSKTPEDKQNDFVPAVFAKDAGEAESYSELLRDHDIPAICGLDEAQKENGESGKKDRRCRMTRGIPVLVPEGLLDEASEIIADRENLAELGLNAAEEEEEEDEDDLDVTEELGPDVSDDLDDQDKDSFLEDDDLDEDQDG